MNIGEVAKALKIKYPSASISRIRFLEKEGLINIKRSSGGTRKFTNKDIEKISKIIDLQENEFYSLKAIKNNPSLLKSNKTKSIKIDHYSIRDMLKQSGLSMAQFEDLVSFGFEANTEIFNNEDLNRMKAWSYFYSLGLEPKNFSVLKSINERSGDFIGFIKSLLPEEKRDEHILIIDNFTNLIRGYLLRDIY
ncbi:MAG: MerR family transcriptional regulator [Candidatus Actinomarina sp.]|nr:MerR family transcriptional regulator [Candidatus Actinomarina sp.]